MSFSWHHSRAHRFFSRARWSRDELGLKLLEIVVERLLPAAATIELAVDDTLLKRWGRKVFGRHPTAATRSGVHEGIRRSTPLGDPAEVCEHKAVGQQQRRWVRSRSRLVSGAVIAGAALAGWLAFIPGLAYADVTSSDYTIGSGTQVSDVAASPSTVAQGTSVQFAVTFTTSTPLIGSDADSVTITPSASLSSTPSNIGITGSSCIQAGTDGGAYSASSITINLTPSCDITAGTEVTVLFTAGAPTFTRSFTVNASTSRSGPASSNAVTVTPSGPQLSAKSQESDAETTYTIGDVPVANLSAAGASLTLTAAATEGSETISFLNSGSGGAGYTVTYTPPGGAPTSDTVTNASAAGATATLTLASALISGDTVEVTATGQNPAPSAISQANDITVAPGNGTPYRTNSINFGGVTAVSVTPSLPVAAATSTYAVNFTASDATSAGGDI